MYRNSSKIMKIVKFCSIVNFVLLVTPSVNAQNGEIGDADLDRFEKDLSVESQTFFNDLSRPNKVKYYKKEVETQKLFRQNMTLLTQLRQNITLLLKTNDYNAFLCASEHIKSNTEMIYPMTRGEWKKDQGTKKKSNSNYDKFMTDFGSIQLPEELLHTITLFTELEKPLDIPNDRNLACNKIRAYFRHIYALLTSFNDEYYRKFLKGESCKQAKMIVENIFRPEFTVDQKEQAIVDFASRYARIRHGINLFSRNFHPLIPAKMLEIIQKNLPSTLPKKNTKNTKRTKIEIPLPQVLDDFGFLKAWNFTNDDLYFLNNVSVAVRPTKDKIYQAYHYDIEVCKGERLLGVLPIAKENVCPTMPMASTPVEPAKLR